MSNLTEQHFTNNNIEIKEIKLITKFELIKFAKSRKSKEEY